MINRLLILFSLLALTGCETAAPNFINGHYYMAGDAACKNMTAYEPGRIMCADAKGKNTGWRTAMTDQELYVYQTNRMIEAQQSAQIDQAIMNQAILNQMQASAPPAVRQTNCQPFGSSINCITY